MEAALNLMQRGHQVDLFEKNKLGGQFDLDYRTPHKKSMEKIVQYYKKELDNSKVNIIYKEASSSDLSSYDGVILATGSVPKVPSIPGLEKFYWAEILLENNLPRNKKVLIIGEGLVGVDIATALIPRDNRVVIVKRTTDFGEDMEMIAKNLSLKMMREKGVVFSDHTHIRKIEGKTVFAERNGEDIRFDDVDIVVVSTGMMSYNTMEQELEATVPIYVIGDAKMVGNAQDAIRDGYMTANVL